MKIVHHTIFDFPLDKHFLGETIIIGSLVKESKDKPYVMSASTNAAYVNGLPSTIALPEYVASQQFGATMKRINYVHLQNKTYIHLIKSLLEDGGPVVLHYHFPRKDLDVTKRVKDEFGDDVKTVLHLHCMPELFQPDDYNRGKDKRTLAEILETGRVDKFIAVSNAVKTAFVYSDLAGADEIETINNGIDSRLYAIPAESEKQGLRKQIGIKGETIVGYVGRMNNNKGVKTMLELLRYHERTGSDYGFVFATSNGEDRQRFFRNLMEIAPGLVEKDQVKIVLDVAKLTGGSSMVDGAVYDHFMSQLSDEGITNSQVFGGVITQPVQGIFDFYIHPAHSEALGLSIVESLTLGVPVVASETGGIPDIVNDSNGVLVRMEKPAKQASLELPLFENDPAYFRNAQKLVEAMSEISHRISKRKIGTPDDIRKQILQTGHTAEAMAEKTERVYSSLCGEGNGR